MPTTATAPTQGAVSVKRRVFPAGTFEAQGADAHYVSLHVGRPVRVCCYRDGKVRRGVQAPGDAEIIPFGQPALWIDEAPAEVLSVRIDPAFVTTIAAQIGQGAQNRQLVSHLNIKDAQLNHIALALEAAFKDADRPSPLLVDSLAAALAIRLIENFSEATRPETRKLPPRKLKDVIEFIEANLTGAIRLNDLAAAAGASLSSFKPMFKHATGLSPYQYILRRRVEKAADLVRESRLPLSEIALEAGFSHQSHLTRSMRAVLKTTPGKLAAASRRQ